MFVAEMCTFFSVYTTQDGLSLGKCSILYVRKLAFVIEICDFFWSKILTKKSLNKEHF